MRVISKEIREQQLKSVQGMVFVKWVDEARYFAKSKAVMRCTEGHEWQASVDGLLRGKGCPKCKGKYVYTQHEREEQLKSIDGVTFLRWDEGVYKNSSSKAVMVCDVHGLEWSVNVNNIVNSGHRCPKCSSKYRYSQKEREDMLKLIDGVEFVTWPDGYKNSHSKARMRCLSHNIEWDSEILSLINANSRCPTCAIEYRAGKKRSPQELCEKKLSEIEGLEFVEWVDGYYKNNMSLARMKCACGVLWEAGFRYILKRKSCPECAQYGFNRSKPSTLYALRSVCGNNIKIGISNKYEQRVSTLRRKTPFDFNVISLLHFENGHDVAELEKMFHSQFKSNDLVGFDGATEWLEFDPQILELLRILGG